MSKKQSKVILFSSEKLRKAVNTTGLNSSQKLVFTEIVARVDWSKNPTESVVSMTKGQIVSEIGGSIGERQVQNIINFLRETGFIEVYTRKASNDTEGSNGYRDKCNEFRLTPLLMLYYDKSCLERELARPKNAGRSEEIQLRIQSLKSEIAALCESAMTQTERPEVRRGKKASCVKALHKKRRQLESERDMAIKSRDIESAELLMREIEEVKKNIAESRSDFIRQDEELQSVEIKEFDQQKFLPLQKLVSPPTETDFSPYSNQVPYVEKPVSHLSISSQCSDQSVSNSHSMKKSQKGLSEIFRRMVEMDLFGRTVRAEKREPEPERSQMSIARKVLLICGQDEAEKERIFRELEESVRLIETIPALQDPPQKGQHTLGRLLYLQDLKDIAYGGVQASFAAEAKKVGVLRLAKVRGWDPALTVRWLTDSKAADEEIYDAFEREFGQKARRVPGDQAEQTGDASGTGPAEAPAETGEENQPAPGSITPAPEEPADFGWEPDYDDDCPTAGELNAVFCDEAEGGIPEEQTEAPEASGDTQAPPVTQTTTEKAPMGSEAEAPDSVKPQATIAQEKKEMGEVSGQGKSSADDFQERIAALLNRAEGKTGKARQKIWDQAMALMKERDEAKKQAKTGAPPPNLTPDVLTPAAGGEAVEQSATQAKKVQQFSVNDPSGFDMPEFVSSPPPEEMGRGQKIDTPNRGQATRISDDVLDDFIFGDSGESALESGVWLDKKGVPSPETTRTTQDAKDGTVADPIRGEQEVQSAEAKGAENVDILEGLNSSPSTNQDGELKYPRKVESTQSNTKFDAQLDESILAGLGENEPAAGGLSGSGPEKTGYDVLESSVAADSTTGSVVVEKQRPDASVGSGLNGTCESKSEFSDATTQPVESGSDPEKHKPDASAGSGSQESISVASDFTTAASESGSAPRPSGVSETSRGARAVLYGNLRGNSQKMPAGTESGPEKQRPEAAIDSGLATHFSEFFTSADSNISESAGQGWGYTGEENQRPEAQRGSGLDSSKQEKNLPALIRSAQDTEQVKLFCQGSAITGVNNQEPETSQASGPAMVIMENQPDPITGFGISPEHAIRLALGTAGPPAEQKKSVAGRKNIPAEQNTDPTQEKSVSAGKKKNSGNVAVRDSGKRELTPPSTESTDGGEVSCILPENTTTRRNSEEVGLLPGETVDEYVKRACRVCFRGKLAQQFQNCERIRELPSEREKLREARQLLTGIQKPKTAA